MPLMGAIYVGQSGIQTSQNSLNTTAHNLSNIETKGYTRQQILQGNKFYNKVGVASVSNMQVGIGVDYTKTRQVRDQFLDASYRKESGRAGFYDICAETTDEIQTIIGEMEGASFANSLSDLWTAVQELQKDPASAVTQGMFVAECSQFLERAQAVSQGLIEYQENLNSRVVDKVNEINEYANQIFRLNRAIQKNESGVEEANDLRDQRNLILDKLSALVKTNVVDDGSDGVEVYVEGVPLVLDDYINSMTAVKHENGFYDVTWGPDYNDASVFNFGQEICSDFDTDIGELKALIYSRGDHRANYSDIDETVPNAQYKYNKSDDGSFIPVASSVVMNTQAEFDKLVHDVVTAINNILTGGNPDTPVNEANATGIEIFVRLGSDRYDGGTYVPEKTDKSPVDVSSMYTVSNLKINPILLKQPTTNSFIKEDGSVDVEKATAMSEAFARDNKLNLNPNTKSTFNYVDFYSALVGQVGNAGYIYSSMQESQANTVKSIENSRQEVVGVSSDDELTNMIKFQNAFNASSRYINVINDMLDTIINRLS